MVSASGTTASGKVAMTSTVQDIATGEKRIVSAERDDYASARDAIDAQVAEGERILFYRRVFD